MRVELICHEPIAVDETAEQGWADVWVRFRSKGKTHRYGPTLCTRADLESDLEICFEIRAEKPSQKNWYAKEIKRKQRALALMDKGQQVVIDTNWDNGTPTIYINKDSLNRGDAEKMIDAMMRHLGFDRFHFKWIRKTEIVVCPISIPPRRLRDVAA